MYNCCHFPQGKCGLKFEDIIGCIGADMSLPSGEVWIEINMLENVNVIVKGHFPQGKCGLKSQWIHQIPDGLFVTSLRGSVD